MTAPDAVRPRGWWVRVSLLWALAAVVLATALLLTYDYAARTVEINQLYLDSDYRDRDFEEIEAKAQAAYALVSFFTPLYAAVPLLLVLVLAVHARGWQVMRARARAATPGRPAH